MIDWRALAPQAEALARYAALCEAKAGRLPWTGALAQMHNRRWLKEQAPDTLQRYPGAIEEGQCECGGICLIGAADETGLYHRCTACQAVYRVAWSNDAKET